MPAATPRLSIIGTVQPGAEAESQLHVPFCMFASACLCPAKWCWACARLCLCSCITGHVQWWQRCDTTAMCPASIRRKPMFCPCRIFSLPAVASWC
eukprot:351140-Chlamydomonas_euryale.AAC.34